MRQHLILCAGALLLPLFAPTVQSSGIEENIANLNLPNHSQDESAILQLLPELIHKIAWEHLDKADIPSLMSSCKEISKLKPTPAQQLLRPFLLKMDDAALVKQLEKLRRENRVSVPQATISRLSARDTAIALMLFRRWKMLNNVEPSRKVELLNTIVMHLPIVKTFIWPLKRSDYGEEVIQHMLRDQGIATRLPAAPSLRSDVQKVVDRVVDDMSHLQETHLVTPSSSKPTKYAAALRHPDFPARLLRQLLSRRLQPDVDTLMQLVQHGVEFPFAEFLKEVEAPNIADMIPYLNLTNAHNVFNLNLTPEQIQPLLVNPEFRSRITHNFNAFLRSFWVWGPEEDEDDYFERDPYRHALQENSALRSVFGTAEFQHFANFLIPMTYERHPVEFLVLLCGKRYGGIASPPITKPILPTNGVVSIPMPRLLNSMEDLRNDLESLPIDIHDMTNMVTLDHSKVSQWLQAPRRATWQRLSRLVNVLGYVLRSFAARYFI